METITQAPVSLTQSAVEEIKRLMQEPGFEKGMYLRVGVKGGGCSGMSYVLGFDKQEADDDLYEIEEILPAHIKEKYTLQITINHHLPKDEWNLGYTKLSSLVS